MKPIVESLLDTDLYKFTMMQCVFHHFPKAKALYRFQCRNQIPTSHLKDKVEAQVKSLCHLKLTQDELSYLEALPYMQADFIAYLRDFRLSDQHILVETDGDALAVTIEGLWLETILFEVPVLAIISECYSKSVESANTWSSAEAILLSKIDYLNSLPEQAFGFTDFGTRRRYCKQWHEALITLLKDKVPHRLQGTSNIALAKKYNLPPIGTMAHEFLQAAQVLAPKLEYSQAYALEVWLKEYPHHLGIALTDCITMDVFLRTFDAALAQRYHGLRQDSGDPFEWTRKALAHYESLGISPKEKTFIYSDRLTFPKAYEIYQTFKEKVKPAFGIGTYLTNDVGFKPLDIVIKLNQLNSQHVIKISDSPGKIICDDLSYLNYFKQTFGL